MSFLDPSGVHVGDTFDGGVLDAERIIAYGWWTDDVQSVITLLPRHRQDEGNYATFYLDALGRRQHVVFHRNIVGAVTRYTDEMGMDV